jgi:hypothetical protein
MADSAASSCRSELSAYCSAFQADDTLITILPAFDSAVPLTLISTAPVGPFQAGMPTAVPLWIAMLFHQRCLCAISPPAWLTASNLSEILAYEKAHESMWADMGRLPVQYYEIARRLTGRRGIVFPDDASSRHAVSGGGSSSQSQVLALLVQDILEVRVDKLRQQLPAVLVKQQQLKSLDDENFKNPSDLMLEINGIGSQELALLRPFIQQALSDRAFLLAPAKLEIKRTDKVPIPSSSKATTDAKSSSVATEVDTTETSRPRVPLRRFRR